jgi:hypothetical protein
MKTIMNTGFVLLLAALPAGVNANPDPATQGQESYWTGTLTAVNTGEKTLRGERWRLPKTFHLGVQCAISTIDNKQAALGDLRPGEEVQIRYQDAEGVLVADRIAEKALRYNGSVRDVDLKAGTVTMAEAPLYQPFRAPKGFRLAGDCKVILWNGQEGRLADVRPGDQISVVYELPEGSQIAYRIREKTTTFEGVADAINLKARTLKAREGSVEKQFTLGRGCQVVRSGERSGHLRDLRLGRAYEFTYENVNGINVLDRIAPAPLAKTAETASLR